MGLTQKFFVRKEKTVTRNRKFYAEMKCYGNIKLIDEVEELKIFGPQGYDVLFEDYTIVELYGLYALDDYLKGLYDYEQDCIYLNVDFINELIEKIPELIEKEDNNDKKPAYENLINVLQKAKELLYKYKYDLCYISF